MYVGESLNGTRQALAATVLLVEDEPIIRLDLASELRGARYDVIEASNADEAFAALQSHPVDLMISDVVMPGSMDGVQLAARARQICSGVKIIIVSGQLFSSPPRNLADGYFPKPCGSLAVLKSCRRLLNERPVSCTADPTFRAQKV
jgi:CheY-like chemotaxis protein